MHSFLNVYPCGNIKKGLKFVMTRSLLSNISSHLSNTECQLFKTVIVVMEKMKILKVLLSVLKKRQATEYGQGEEEL